VADGLITRPPAAVPPPAESIAGRIQRLYTRTPWWARVLIVFALSRVFSTALILVFAHLQATNPWTLAHPHYADYARIWDGQWYYVVAETGYPRSLPVDTLGHIGQNQWAFLPVYPFLVKALTILTGAAFSPVAVFVSVVSAAGSALVLHRLAARFLSPASALFAVVLFCVAPLSPLFQLDYAESLFLLEIAAALLLLVERRYGWLLAVLTVAAFTRPGVIAFAPALVALWVVRHRRRDRDAFEGPERRILGATAIASGILGFAWPVVAAIATGDLHAYTDTELSWRAAYIGYGSLFPFAAWVQGANWWLPGGAGILVLAVAVVLFALFQFSPWVRRLPVELRLWVAAYTVYLLAVFFPQSSTFRVLMPIFPLLGALAVPRSRVFRALLVVGGLAGQVVWMYLCWFVDGYDWTPP
jgi:hypothetical protein